MADKKLENPTFDDDGNCTNLGKCGNVNTTVPRTPDNPGGHFVKEKTRIANEKRDAEKAEASKAAHAAQSAATAAEVKASEADQLARAAASVAAEAKVDAKQAKEAVAATG